MATIPHSEFERDLLGAVLATGGRVLGRCGHVQPEDFFHPSHRATWEAIRGLESKAAPIEPETVAEQMRAAGTLENLKILDGETFIAELVLACYAPANVDYYVRKVLDAAEARRRIEFSRRKLSEGTRDGQDPAEFSRDFDSDVLALERATPSERVSMGKVVAELVRALDQRYEQPDATAGIKTGIAAIDDMTGGLRDGDLTVLAARPSMGKTALACNVAARAAFSGTNVLFVSLEMSPLSICERMLAAERIRYAALRAPRLMRSDEWAKATSGGVKLKGLPIWFETRTTELSDLKRSVKRWRLEDSHGKPGIVVVDYMQLIGVDKATSREREVAEVSRTMKLLAQECGVPVIALSQLNRQLESRTDKRPMLSDLRESGAIEQDADLVWFLFRPAVYDEQADPKEAELIIAKHRNGAVGKIDLRWEPDFQTFDSVRK
jgi:replicative DNA helicase